MILRIKQALLLAGAVSVAATGRAQDLELKTPGILRVIVQMDGLPELYVVNQPLGIEREMLEGFARLHNLRIETVPAPLPDRVAWLLQDKGDMLGGGVVTTESRKKVVDFAAETFPIRHVVVTRKPHPMVKTIDALRAERVGTILNSSWYEEALAAGVPKANIDDSFITTDQLLAALKTDKVSCVIMSVIWAMANRRRDPALEVGIMVGAPTSISFAVRKNQPRLLQALNEYVVATRKTPTWSRLVVKYLGSDSLEVLKKSRE